MLFGFMKMKTDQNRLYLYQSKAYIINSMNVLLNHFTMTQLRDHEALTDEEKQRIAYFMAIKVEKVPSVLKDLSTAVNEMEDYLSRLRAAQQQQRTRESTLV